MQTLQQVQRILSSRGCSTSGNPPHANSANSSRLACCAYPSTSCSIPAENHVDQVRRQRPGRRRWSLASRHPVLIAQSSIETDVDLPLVGDTLVSTRFVAETCLPTRTGKYRVRAYRHSVSSLVWTVSRRDVNRHS